MENKKYLSIVALVIIAMIYYKRQKTSNIGEKMMFGGLMAVPAYFLFKDWYETKNKDKIGNYNVIDIFNVFSS